MGRKRGGGDKLLLHLGLSFFALRKEACFCLFLVTTEARKEGHLQERDGEELVVGVNQKGTRQ